MRIGRVMLGSLARGGSPGACSFLGAGRSSSILRWAAVSTLWYSLAPCTEVRAVMGRR